MDTMDTINDTISDNNEKFIIRFVKKLNADIPCPPAEEY